MAVKELHGEGGNQTTFPGDAEKQMPVGEVAIAYYRRLVDATKEKLRNSPGMAEFHGLGAQELTFSHKRAIVQQYVAAIVHARGDKGVQLAQIGKNGRDKVELAAAEGTAKAALHKEYAAADDQVALCALHGKSPSYTDDRAFMHLIEASKGPLPAPMKLK